jgi:hypothetical protein
MGKLLFFVSTVLLMMVFIFTFPNGSLSQDSVVQNVAEGKISYYENDANNQDPNFVMNGTITVTNSDVSSYNTHNNSSKLSFDTLSSPMVPTKDIKKHSEILDENNVSIVDQYSFKDLRENGGANQTLIVLGSNNPMDEIISVFKKITSTLPYG